MSEENVNEVVEAEGSAEEEVQDPKALLKAHKELKWDLEKYKSDVEKYKSDIAVYKKQLEDTAPKADKYKTRAVKAEAKIALTESGVKNPDRILKHLDLSDLDFDDEGNLPGLKGKVESLQAELPELFVAKLRAGDVEQFEKTSAPTKPLSASEKQFKMLMKKR